jgi:hypothetical protein
VCPLPAVYFRVWTLLQCSMVSTPKRFAEVPRASPKQLRAGYACRSRAFACELANVRMEMSASLGALQMMKKKKRSAAQRLVAASALEKLHKKHRAVLEASSGAAPADSGTDPPPAGRFRRSCRTPTAQVHSESTRPLQLRTAPPQSDQSSSSAWPMNARPHPVRAWRVQRACLLGCAGVCVSRPSVLSVRCTRVHARTHTPILTRISEETAYKFRQARWAI